MNWQSCFLWLAVLILSLSPYVLSIEYKPTDRKCLATCMDYCVNDSESGIPVDLCSNACMTMCYSARRDVGAVDSNGQGDK